MLKTAPRLSATAPLARRFLLSRLQGGAVLFEARGRWVVRELAAIEAEIAAEVGASRKISDAVLDISAIEDFDTAGAMALQKLLISLARSGARAVLRGASPEQKILLEEVNRNSLAERPLPPRENSALRLGADILATTLTIGRDTVRLTAFLGEVTASLARVMARPWRFRWISFVHHLDRAGLRAVPIVSLICVLIGAVIMQQGIFQLRFFGAEVLAVDMLGILALREAGILLTSVIVAGRSASAFTAEIGTMKMREEIDAMRTLGIDPLETLVLPRILALIVALPLLVFLADMMCLLGGAIMAKLYLDMDFQLFLQRLNSAVELRHFFVGLVKAPFAALVIGLVGCLEGLSVKGTAESVGRQVTSAVVKAIFLVIVLDALFAIFLSESGF